MPASPVYPRIGYCQPHWTTWIMLGGVILQGKLGAANSSRRRNACLVTLKQPVYTASCCVRQARGDVESRWHLGLSHSLAFSSAHVLFQMWMWPSSSLHIRYCWMMTTFSLCCTWRLSIMERTIKVCCSFLDLSALTGHCLFSHLCFHPPPQKPYHFWP